MTPEEFALVLDEFCTLTYFDEKFEFTDEEFAAYFDKLKVLERINKRFSLQDLKMDFTLNLCIMYYESGKYSFIYRSFQLWRGLWNWNIEKDGETDCVNAADLEPQEQQAYDLVEVSGHNCRVLISEVREEESDLHQAMLNPYFPYMLEYREMKKCLYELEDQLTDSASAEYEEIFYEIVNNTWHINRKDFEVKQR